MCPICDQRNSAAGGLIEIAAKEATPLAGRGPAALALFFDEMAHMANLGANRSAEEVFSAAVPSLTQCQPEEFIYQSSSPWSQQGQFYENYRRGLELDSEGRAVNPDVLVCQLPSWTLYEGWELTGGGLLAYPDGPVLPRIDKAILAYDDKLKREEAANPARSAVEFWAQFRTSPCAYLDPDQVDAIFAPFNGRTLTMQARGTLHHVYMGHADPAKSQKNFALVIGHVAHVDGEDHMVVDVIRVSRPEDFFDHVVDYRQIETEIEQYLQAFAMTRFTFDQFSSVGSIQRLRAYVARSKLPRRTDIHERTANARDNYRIAEQFKTALGMGRVHAPFHELARAELLALEEQGERKIGHPTAGQIQTDDIADALFNLFDNLLGGVDLAAQFSATPPRVGIPASCPFTPDPDIAAQFSAAGRRTRFGHGAQRGSGGGGPARGRGR